MEKKKPTRAIAIHGILSVILAFIAGVNLNIR